MLTIAIQLTNRTYGACPWDRAHIEGAIENIPSPTRILRAIVSGAFMAGFGESPAMKAILQQLAGAAPVYYIPRGEYVALQTFRKDETGEQGLLYKSGKMNVEPYYSYDADDDTFLLRWSAELSEAELELLRLALQQVHYLGRSEHRAVWTVYLSSVDDEVFNCRPHQNGDERVQMVEVDSIDSLYLAPGVSNSKLKSGVPGFYTISYKIDRSQRSRSAVEDVVEVDSVILKIVLSYLLPAQNAVYWCNKLHKALVQKSPETEKFRNGSLTIAPLYKDLHFQEISLYCSEGFTDDDLHIIDSVRRLRSNSGDVELFVEQAFKAPEQGATRWVSASPFFLALAPALKYGRGGRIRNTGFRLLTGTTFIKNGCEHQALKYFLRRCNVSEGVVYQEVDGFLGAFRDDDLLAVCEKVEEWLGYWQWETRRFSGGEQKEVAPASPIGYRVWIRSELPVRGSVTIGYGKNFGLGVLCAAG